MSKQDYWFSLVREQEQSDGSISAFCAIRAIKLPTFHYWRKRYKQAKSAPGGFIELSAAAGQERCIHICYPNGVNVRLLSSDLSLVAQLIRLV